MRWAYVDLICDGAAGRVQVRRRKGKDGADHALTIPHRSHPPTTQPTQMGRHRGSAVPISLLSLSTEL